jgi:beta-glucosidase
MRRAAIALFLVLVSGLQASAQSSSPPQTSVATQTRQEAKPAYLDPGIPIEQRVNDLVSRMTLEEKVSQMQDIAPAIPQLGIPAYNWWNEALHGVARAGNATVFPQAIGLAATWDTDLMHRVADVISTEARAKYNDAQAHGNTARYFGLTFWSPNINIFRDPRWGRGQETYGEDPFLTARLGVAFVTGMQGDDPRYLKTVSTPKHFAVHSGPEPSRHAFDVPVSLHDLADTYLPAFRATIVESHADSVMCAYNSVLGEPACANGMLFGKLRHDWGFGGYVVSDCGAVSDIYRFHRFAADASNAAAISVKAGTDLSCGTEYRALIDAVRDQFISEAEIDAAVKRLFIARFRLGMFDPPEMVPWSKLTIADNDTPEHRALALQAARESIVLLKNDHGVLPLKSGVKRIEVVGPTADSLEVLQGNYNGTPSSSTTVLSGILRRFQNLNVHYTPGSQLTEVGTDVEAMAAMRRDAATAAQESDVIIAVVGITPELEGEEMQTNAVGFSGGDRTSLDLPRPQQELLEALAATGKPLIVVLTSGSALGVNWAQEHAAAILEAWYPGEEGGTAVAEILAGDYNPAGRFPVTFYTGVSQLPPFEDYSMANRTYRYFTGTPLYLFGFGLSYAKFTYSHVHVGQKAIAPDGVVSISVDVRNNGAIAGDEVVQLYVSHPGVQGAPIRSLEEFARVHLAAGEQKTMNFILRERQLSVVDSSGERRIVPGTVKVWIGGGQPVVGHGQSSPPGVKAHFRIEGGVALPN